MRKRSVTLPLHRMGHDGKPAVHVRHIHAGAPLAPTIEPVHRDDYYLFLVQQTGESRFMIDFMEVTPSGCCVQVIRPGQAHRFLAAQQVSGWLVALENDLLTAGVRQALEAATALYALTVADYVQLERMITALQAVLPVTDLLGRQVAVHLAAAFSATVARLSQQTVAPDKPQQRALAVAQQFKQLVAKHFRDKRLPGQYAALMRLSPAYVNECVKAATGLPVTHWIQEAMLLEAKRMLAHSDQSIKEIAFSMGYADPAYFSRVFTRTQGTTPAAFRKAYRE